MVTTVGILSILTQDSLLGLLGDLLYHPTTTSIHKRGLHTPELKFQCTTNVVPCDRPWGRMLRPCSISPSWLEENQDFFPLTLFLHHPLPPASSIVRCTEKGILGMVYLENNPRTAPWGRSMAMFWNLWHISGWPQTFGFLLTQPSEFLGWRMESHTRFRGREILIHKIPRIQNLRGATWTNQQSKGRCKLMDDSLSKNQKHCSCN